MRFRTTSATFAVAALALTFAACGGGDDEGAGGEAAADSPLAQALAADMVADADDGPVGTEEEAQCWAGKVVSGIGEDRLTELGVTAENVPDLDALDLTEDEVGTVVDTMFECIDVSAALAQELAGEFGDEAASCVADKLDADLVKDLMLSEFNGSEPSGDFFQTFLDIASECDLPLN